MELLRDLPGLTEDFRRSLGVVSASRLVDGISVSCYELCEMPSLVETAGLSLENPQVPDDNRLLERIQ